MRIILYEKEKNSGNDFIQEVYTQPDLYSREKSQWYVTIGGFVIDESEGVLEKEGMVAEVWKPTPPNNIQACVICTRFEPWNWKHLMLEKALYFDIQESWIHV